MSPHDEQNDPVWDLLKQARKSEASPFFSRNVVREIRKLDAEQNARPSVVRWFAWLRQPVAAWGAVATVAALASIVAVNGLRSSSAPEAVAVVTEPVAAEVAEAEFDPASEVSNLEYLGQLMAVTDPAALDDAALADLFF
ncbi:MAG: hypothetical protein KDM63_15160 [Verrucomicrobiae bacterium]|nr:hypothetical protein [Verrucomicrobiae bacterium]